MEAETILIVDDNREIVDSLGKLLKLEGYFILTAYDGMEALAVLEKNPVDLILLDVMMPRLNGLSALMKIREHHKIPCIILSAKTEESDKVSGLMLGADDYLTKPFSPSELTARVDAIYRRVCMSFIKDEKSSILKSGPFILDIKSRTVTKNGLLIDLTQVEYQIIEYFMNNKNTALDRSSILTHIWGENYYGDDKIVDVNIRRIRMKIEDEPSSPKYILTIWGYGYKWDEK